MLDDPAELPNRGEEAEGSYGKLPTKHKKALPEPNRVFGMRKNLT
jgi:hypothetical protein